MSSCNFSTFLALTCSLKYCTTSCTFPRHKCPPVNFPVIGMAKIKITIQDDFGKVITETADREYQLDLGKATLTEIEGAVEDFKKRALADIEKDFLHDAQTRFVQEQKKADSPGFSGKIPTP